MQYIQPANRNQMSFGSLEDAVDSDNSVRFIEAFVEQLELNQLGYQSNTLKSEGRPPFHPKVFLKLYLYGYHNGREIQTCKDQNITTICAQQELSEANHELLLKIIMQ